MKEANNEDKKDPHGCPNPASMELEAPTWNPVATSEARLSMLAMHVSNHVARIYNELMHDVRSHCFVLQE